MVTFPWQHPARAACVSGPGNLMCSGEAVDSWYSYDVRPAFWLNLES
ncbi:MAG: hypothetical protein LBU50_05670 [Cellulomonas sp.]|nr:hypothetical protein [Cellulomonas sp.]